MDKKNVYTLLRCPRTHIELKKLSSEKLVSNGIEKIEYKIVDGLPILIDYSKSILGEKDILQQQAKSFVKRQKYKGLKRVLKRIVSPPNRISAKNVGAILEILSNRKIKNSDVDPKILVIGGGTVGEGMLPLYESPDLLIVAFDIYKSNTVHFIADGHSIPLLDNYFDCVVVQAVLEHVLDPKQVVSEITRVLKMDGIVYSETPFLQHVHEGAYDFTRFTESGHRYLFKQYKEIKSGVLTGAGTQLLWSIEHFFRGLFRSRFAGKVMKILFFWVQRMDSFIQEPYSVDSASGLYFLGEKSAFEFKPKEIIRYYKGAQ